MKAAIVTAFPRDPSRPQGGVEAVSVNLVRALARQSNLEVHVITTDRECARVSESTWSGAHIHRLPQSNTRLLRYAVGEGRKQIQDFLRQLRPDVVHAHDTYGLMVRGLALPRVFTVHGFIHEDTRYDSGRLARLRAWMWRRAETRAWADQPHIISINPCVRAKLEGIARGEIHDIENPIGEQFFSIPRQEEAGTIFCAAVIRRLKNTLGLVKAFDIVQQRAPLARLCLAGAEGEDDYAAELRQFIANRGLANKVSMPGAISADQVRGELGRASVFALVSLQENAPMGIAEALAAGVPVVTSNRCGMPHMVRDGETGFLVDPLRPEDIAAKLERLVQDSALRARMGANARQFASERFHPDRVAEKTLAVYQQAVRN